MARIKPFDIRRLKSFHREGAHLPGTAPEDEDKIADLDPNLKPEEHSYVNHYVSYADVLLKHKESPRQEPPDENPDENKDAESVKEPPPNNVVEMPQRVAEGQSDQPKKNKGEVA